MIGSSAGFQPFGLFKGCTPQLHTEIKKDEETGGPWPVEQEARKAEESVSLFSSLRKRRYRDTDVNGDTVEYM